MLWACTPQINLFHINSPALLRFLIGYLKEGQIQNEEEKLMLTMFYYSFYQKHPEKEGFCSIEDGVQRIISR